MTPYEKAQSGLKLIEEAIWETLSHSEVMSNATVTQRLGLESDQGGKQKDYLAYSILGRLMKSGKVQKVAGGSERAGSVGYVRIPE